MAFEPANSLKSRTYVGLIVAQFLAAFNDQAIHASAMFFAISKRTMTEANAITLMPILFYLPWAIFPTLAGYLADRFSKRNTLVFWKFAEVGITLIALLGFYLGSVHNLDVGPVLVLATVFLMGMHSAFFVPAKYGAMPEILQPHLLSKGNGVLESASFLAVILGTVCGGVLSDENVFKGREWLIGLLLVTLAIIGALASLLIHKMPAANPHRPFPANLFKPLWVNLKAMWKSRPLRLALMGLAFFTFLVAYMRATVYMHGESQVPRWSELKTSVIVGMTAIGISIGGLVAGFLSGGKVELGLVPFGALGMITSCVIAAALLFHLSGLIVCIILIGFFSGFYTVPLFTLLQHRAPKSSKGDFVATNNFASVVGAITASFLFKVLVFGTEMTGLAPTVPQIDKVAQGRLDDLHYNKHGRLTDVTIDGTKLKKGEYELTSRAIAKDSDVIVSEYTIAGQDYYRLRPMNADLTPAYDKEPIPKYLFLGAGFITALILFALWWELPDFFVRTMLWLKSLGKFRITVVGVNNLPGDGSLILATNCETAEQCLEVLSGTDRYTRFLYVDRNGAAPLPRWLKYAVKRTRLAQLDQESVLSPEGWDFLAGNAVDFLRSGAILGIQGVTAAVEPAVERFLCEVHKKQPAILLPVYCGSPGQGSKYAHLVRIVIGKPLPPLSPVKVIRAEIDSLRLQLENLESQGLEPGTSMLH
jgi:MFS family permease